MQTQINDGITISPVRPQRGRMRRFILREFQFVLSVVVSAVVLLSVWPQKLAQTQGLLAVLAVLIYCAYLLAKHRWRRSRSAQGRSESQILQFARVMLLIGGVTFFRYLLRFTDGPSNPSTVGTLWLLYLLPLFTVSQYGSTIQLALAFAATAIGIYLTEPATQVAEYGLLVIKPVTASMLVKTAWLGIPAFIHYTFLRSVGDTLADMLLIQDVQTGLRAKVISFSDTESHPRESDYLGSAVTQIIDDVGYDDVSIFRITDDGHALRCVASGSDRGSCLLQTPFILGLAETESIIGHVAKTGRPYVSNNVHRDPYYLVHPAFPDTKSELAVPIYCRDRLYGVLDVQVSQRDFFRTYDVQSICILADLIGWVIDSAEQAIFLGWTARVIGSIASSLFSRDELEDTLQEIADSAHRELNADPVILYSYLPGIDGDVVGPIVSGHPLQPELLVRNGITHDSIVARVRDASWTTKFYKQIEQADLLTDPLLSPSRRHIQTGRQPFIAREKIRSLYITRLLHDDECLGVLFLNFRSPQAFTELELKRYDYFAQLASLAMQKMHAYEQTRRVEMADLAYSVHDMLVGDAIGIQLTLESLDMSPPGSVEEAWNDGIRSDIMQMTQQLHDDIRHIFTLLHSEQPTELKKEIDRLAMIRRPGFKPEMITRWDGDPSRVPPAIASALVFCAKEAMTNAARHGNATEMHISTFVTEELVRLTVRDDGCGLDLDTISTNQKHPKTIQARVARLGGRTQIMQRDDGGTELTIEFGL